MMMSHHHHHQQQQQQQEVEKTKTDDEHEHDTVMPGFRFHPTEEELIDYYLRRKVEGKRFHVELITFLDLYRYDPWELPGLAAIGEKEWFFYVPRDRKYRNGDRPNRVTTSGYWKATGADRTIRKTENMETIGLRKTLVFYSGKAPKGVRSSWIMNEYRLPPSHTQRLIHTAEISLCRVYKRTVIEDHSSLIRSHPAAATTSSSSSKKNKNKNQTRTQESAAIEEMFHHPYNATNQMEIITNNCNNNVLTSPALISRQDSCLHDLSLLPLSLTHSSTVNSLSEYITSSSNISSLFPKYPSFVSSSHVTDDLHRLVNFQQHVSSINHHPDLIPSQPQHPSSFRMLQPGTFQTTEYGYVDTRYADM